MGWGAAYETPDEQAEKQAQREAAARVDQRRQMSAFEQQAIDVMREAVAHLGAISESFAIVAACSEAAAPMYELDTETGLVRAPKWIRDVAEHVGRQLTSVLLHGVGDQGITGGEAGDASAGPGDPSGPARPENHCDRYSTKDHCGQIHEDELGGWHECYEVAEAHQHRCLCGLSWSESPN